MTNRSITAALACALVAGSAAFAAIPAEAASVARVRYADLDLGSAAGQQTLVRRLSGAVSLVCPAQTADWVAQQDCRRSALGRAHADLHKAGVAAF